MIWDIESGGLFLKSCVIYLKKYLGLVHQQFLVREVSTRILCNIAKQPIIFQFKEIDIMGF